MKEQQTLTVEMKAKAMDQLILELRKQGYLIHSVLWRDLLRSEIVLLIEGEIPDKVKLTAPWQGARQ